MQLHAILLKHEKTHMENKKENFSKKLKSLFEEKRKSDGSKYTQTEVIEGTKGVLTRVYLWKLRTGRASNPGYQIIKAIADFFGVNPSYFFVEGDQVATQPQEPPDTVDQIAFRAGELDEEGKQTVLNMIDYILEQRKRGQVKKKK